MKIFLGKPARAPKARVYALHLLHAAQGKVLHHFYKYLRKGARIIAGAVVLKGRYLKIFAYGVQLIIAQANIQRLRQRQRIDISVPELNAIALACGFDKADIEAVRIVRH